ncbi:2-C-methyl-D-erythritol 4-phosphate cytidylyltransferase [Alteribacillus sp. HJP-4]|uniref:2-C-methyl-D-erythritol 4-phosphate cytidylyltransferase n=1 Tax=Alteribacillus sp. HJP-4 TaxID=2775394 RepID=UPI0035CCDD3C
MKYTVIIPAAGQGKRMKAGHNKQFLMLENSPLIIHTVSVFEKDPWCERIIVVVNPSEKEDMSSLFDEWNITKVTDVIAGGRERQDSVYEGLKILDDNKELLVLVHDGARPFVQADSIHSLVREAAEMGAAVLGTKMKDTVKKVENGVVTETMQRSQLWGVQTPQAFQFKIVMQAYNKAAADNFSGTDDTSLVERLGFKVHIVEGSYDNIKLTTPEDMMVAKAILTQRKGD